MNTYNADGLGLARLTDDARTELKQFLLVEQQHGRVVCVQLQDNQDDTYIYGYYSKSIDEALDYALSGGTWSYHQPSYYLERLTGWEVE